MMLLSGFTRLISEQAALPFCFPINTLMQEIERCLSGEFDGLREKTKWILTFVGSTKEMARST